MRTAIAIGWLSAATVVSEKGGLPGFGGGEHFAERDDREAEREARNSKELHGSVHPFRLNTRIRPSCTTVTASAPSPV